MCLRERQQIVISIVAVALLAGFVVFSYLPLRQRRRTVEMEKAAHKIAITKTMVESSKLPELKHELETLRSKVGDYDARIPQQTGLGVFLQRIARLMNENELTEQLIEPGREVEADGLVRVPVGMQCKGSLEHIFSFFDSLQSLDRLVRIEKVKLANDKDFKGQVSMKVETVIYHRKVNGSALQEG